MLLGSGRSGDQRGNKNIAQEHDQVLVPYFGTLFQEKECCRSGWLSMPRSRSTDYLLARENRP
jgi:hypothetical protein